MRRLTVAVSVWTLLLLTSAVNAEETGQPSPVSPLRILDECVDAVQNGDFDRYVDHLTPEEQRLQAGYALFVSSVMLRSMEDNAHQIGPETLLLLRAMDDLIGQHALTEGHASGPSQMATQVSAATAVVNQVFAASFNGGVRDTVLRGAEFSELRSIHVKSAGLLEDPRSFLVAALTELVRPVQITGPQPTEPENNFDFADLAEQLERQQWTLYTRGSYAVAVPKAGNAQPQEGEAGSDSPVQDMSPTLPIRVEFQKVEGVWKISHLLPTSTLMSTTSVAPAYCESPYCAPPSAPSYAQPLTAPAPYPGASFPAPARPTGAPQ